MIYLVTGQQELFQSTEYTLMTIEDSLQLLDSCKVLQYDSETNGRDARINKLLCIQFGNKEKDFQMVIDCNTVDVRRYKDILENKGLIGQNLKFDLTFLFNYGIVPRKVYDTMIVEQLLYLGYPYLTIHKDEYIRYNYNFPYLENGDIYSLSFSLKAIAAKRLHIDIDKTVRGQIMYRGLDTEVIVYAANDVKYLEDIADSQILDCSKKHCIKGAHIECNFVPVIAYLEWCGIKLDINKWKEKMKNDLACLEENKKALDSFIVSSNMTKYFKIDKQGNLFSGFNLEPKCSINWDSSTQVVKLAKELGFDTSTKDKKTGEDKDSVLEKNLKGQKGINDEFLKLYFDYKASSKVVSTYGQSHLNAVNPKTGRIHTVYKQLGAASGRMSCGSKQSNTDLAKLKHILPSQCSYPK